MKQAGFGDDIQVDRKTVCCVNCEFFEDRTGFCRFNPPVAAQVNIGQCTVNTSLFPKIQVPKMDWCGKFSSIYADG